MSYNEPLTLMEKNMTRFMVDSLMRELNTKSEHWTVKKKGDDIIATHLTGSKLVIPISVVKQYHDYQKKMIDEFQIKIKEYNVELDDSNTQVFIVKNIIEFKKVST